MAATTVKLQGIGAKLVRKSDDKQDERRQHLAIDKWCADNGLVPTYSFQDSGSRDKADDRHDFQTMLELIRNGGPVWRISTSWRSPLKRSVPPQSKSLSLTVLWTRD
jgi:Resolvase, N terminal domain